MRRFVVLLTFIGAGWLIHYIFSGPSEPASVVASVKAGNQVTKDSNRLTNAVGANSPNAATIVSDVKNLQLDNAKLAKTENSSNEQFNRLTTQLVNDNDQYISDVEVFLSNPTQSGVNQIESDTKKVNSVTRQSNALIHKLYN